MSLASNASNDVADQAASAVQPHLNRGHLLGPGGNTYVAHCNHYNCFLQKTLRSRSGLNMDEVLVDVAASQFFITFALTFRTDWPLMQRLEYVETLFKTLGYGNPGVTAAAEENDIIATASHYSEGYRAKFGVQEDPQDFFLTGALQGALTAAYGIDVTVKQQECMAMGHDHNRWTVEKHEDQRENIVAYLEKADKILQHRESLNALSPPDDLPVPEITEAVRDMDLSGDPANGLIPAFNVYLTFIPSLYYNVCSQIFLNRLGDQAVSQAMGQRLLREAGHECGFYTLGNILLSTEYASLTTSHFGASPTEHEALTALFAVVNAFGWGYWQLDTLAEDRLQFTVFNSYEAYNYREYFGMHSDPVCYLHLGGGAAVMNAMRYGDILDSAVEINRTYIDKVFEQSDGFSSTELQCFAVEGTDGPCRFDITR